MMKMEPPQRLLSSPRKFFQSQRSLNTFAIFFLIFGCGLAFGITLSFCFENNPFNLKIVEQLFAVSPLGSKAPSNLLVEESQHLSINETSNLSTGKPSNFSYDEPPNLTMNKPPHPSINEPPNFSVDDKKNNSINEPLNLVIDKHRTKEPQFQPNNNQSDPPFDEPPNLPANKPSNPTIDNPPNPSFDGPKKESRAIGIQENKDSLINPIDVQENVKKEGMQQNIYHETIPFEETENVLLKPNQQLKSQPEPHQPLEQAQIEPQAKSNPEPKSFQQLQLEPQLEPQPLQQPQLEPQLEPYQPLEQAQIEPQDKSNPEPKPFQQLQLEPQPKPQLEPQPLQQPQLEPQLEPHQPLEPAQIEPQAKSNPEPKTFQQLQLEPQPLQQPQLEPQLEPHQPLEQAQLEPQAKSNQEPKSFQQLQLESQPKPQLEPQPLQQPQLEPQPEPHQPLEQAQLETQAKSNLEPKSFQQLQLEPQPNPELEPQPLQQPQLEPQPLKQPQLEPQAKPHPEPKPFQKLQMDSQPKPQLEPQPLKMLEPLPQELTLQKPQLKPPSDKNIMKDDELFMRASMTPKLPENSPNRVQKVAFMFLVRGVLPLAPLWDMFFKGNEGLYSIYVHAQPFFKGDVAQESIFHGRRINSKKVEWGKISMVEAERRLLANALLDASNERFVLLSEACIPLHNFSTIYSYLMGSAHTFVESYDLPGPVGRGRYNSRMQPTVKLQQWRKGSQWKEVDRFLAQKIIADRKYFSLFRRYCKPACYSDEHYIPTYISIKFWKMNSNRTLTWVDWSKGGPHPSRFERDDVTPEFLQGMRYGTECLYNGKPSNMCYMFARKFSPNALSRLLELAPQVLNFND